MIHLGDITKIKGNEVPLVDVITYGAPCQDLSVAGKRAGMKNVIMGDEDSTRSGLFFDAIRVVKEMRNESKRQLSMRGAAFDIRHIQPRYTIYENVPGAFSSNGGEDFRAVLEETCKVADENAYVPQLEKGQKWANAGCIMGDGYSVAWRLHDAQYWGVPQRRKRICVLADYGGNTAPKLLFELLGETEYTEANKIIADIGENSRPEVQVECESLSGNLEQGREEKQSSSATSKDCVGKTGNIEEPTIIQRRFSSVNLYDEGITPTLEAGAGEGGNNMPLIANGVVTKGNGDAFLSEERHTSLSTGGGQAGQGFPCALVFEPGAASRVEGHIYDNEISGSLRANAGDNQQAVCYGISAYESNSMKSSNPHSGIYEADTSRTLDNNGGSPACNQGGMAIVNTYDVRISSDGTKNQRAHCYETDRSRALDTGGEKPDSNHGGVAVVCLESNTLNLAEQHTVCTGVDMYNQSLTGDKTMSITGAATDPHHVPCAVTGIDCYNINETGDVVKTLTSGREDKNNIPCVAYGLDRASYNQGQNALFDFSVDKEIAPPLIAKGPGAVFQKQ